MVTAFTLNFSDVLVPLLLGHQLALVVVGVEADPVEGDGRAEKYLMILEKYLRVVESTSASCP